jgi:hypothetical protein
VLAQEDDGAGLKVKATLTADNRDRLEQRRGRAVPPS